MSLLAFNKTGLPLLLSAGNPAPTLPASSSPPNRGPTVNVTSELRGLTGGQYAALEAQRVAGDVDFEWTGDEEYDVTGLTVGGPSSAIGPFAAGSVIFSGGGSTLLEDANFIYDSTNKVLRIGAGTALTPELAVGNTTDATSSILTWRNINHTATITLDDNFKIDVLTGAELQITVTSNISVGSEAGIGITGAAASTTPSALSLGDGLAELNVLGAGSNLTRVSLSTTNIDIVAPNGDITLQPITSLFLNAAPASGIGVFGATAYAQPSVANFTDGTTGGTADTITDFAGSVYATDAPTIEGNFHQLALKVDSIIDHLQGFGWFASPA